MSSFRPTVVIFSAFFLLGNLILLWGMLLPDMVKAFQMSPAISGAFFSLMSLGSIAGAVVGGKYVQKFHFLKLFAGLAVTESILLTFVSLTSTWQLLLTFIVLVGFTYSIMFTIGHTLIARMYVNKRAAMMGLMDFMFSLGTLTVPLWVVALYWVVDDWHWPVRIIAVCMFFVGCYSFWVAKTQQMPVTESYEHGQSLSYLAVLKKPVFFLMFLVMVGYGAAEWGQGNWFVSYAVDGLEYEAEQARLLLAWFTGGMVISRLGFALLLRWFTSAALMLLLAIFTVLGALTIKLSITSEVLALGNLLLGLGIGGLFPLLLATAMDIDSKNGPILSGIASIGNSIGFQFAGFFTGVFVQQVGITQAFWIVPIASIWLLAFVWLFQRRMMK